MTNIDQRIVFFIYLVHISVQPQIKHVNTLRHH